MAQLITELRERQATVLSEARERLDSITDAMTPAEVQEREAAHDAAMAKYDEIGARIARLEKLEEREKALGNADPRRPNQENRESGQGDNDGGEQLDPGVVFKRAMQFGVSELAPEERELMRNYRAQLTKEQRAQATTGGAAGGYTIPAGFFPEIVKSMALWGPMFDERACRVIRTDTGNSLPVGTVNDTGNTGVDHTENTADADQDVTFGQKQLDAYAHGSGIVKVSLELLQDTAYDFDELLRELFGERLARRGNAKLTTGTGTNQPNGIVTASSLGLTAVSASAIAADELITFQHSVDPAYRASPKAAWMFSDNFLQAVRKLKDGQGNYLWQMGDIRAGEPDRLLQKPYFINQAMATIATGNRVAIFGDMSKYWVRQVKDFQMLTLRERFAEALQVGFMAWNRFDGELVDTAAVKHYKMA